MTERLSPEELTRALQSVAPEGVTATVTFNAARDRYEAVLTPVEGEPVKFDELATFAHLSRPEVVAAFRKEVEGHPLESKTTPNVNRSIVTDQPKAKDEHKDNHKKSESRHA